MKQRLLLIAVVAMLLITTVLALPATLGLDDSASRPLSVVYADDGVATPTPTATPPAPNGGCQGTSSCGG